MRPKCDIRQSPYALMHAPAYCVQAPSYRQRAAPGPAHPRPAAAKEIRVADPKAPTCSMYVCTTIGTLLPPSDDAEDILQAAELALVELGTHLSGLVGED